MNAENDCEKLASGLLEIYEPGLRKLQKQLAELTSYMQVINISKSLSSCQCRMRYASTYLRPPNKFDENLKHKQENEVPKLRQISYTSNTALQFSLGKARDQADHFRNTDNAYSRLKCIDQKRNIQLSGSLSIPNPYGKSRICPEEPKPEQQSEAPPPEKKGLSPKYLISLFVALVSGGILTKLIIDEYFRKEEAPVIITKVNRKPLSSADIPDEVPYLLIGGGTASFAAFRAIKTNDPEARILVVSQEPHNPYMRPPLSKEMFYSDDRAHVDNLKFKQWNGTVRSIFYEPDEFYIDCKSLLDSEYGGIAIAQGWKINKIDPVKKIAYLDDGKEIKYNKCLIATGSTPKINPLFKDLVKSKNVNFFRKIEDFQKVDKAVEKGGTVVIIGNGFLGSELACALGRKSKKKSLKVVQIFKEEEVMTKVLPKYLCRWTSEKVEGEGVEVRRGTEVVSVREVGGKVVVSLVGGERITADHLVVASGSEPVTDLADSAGLEVDPCHGGYLVNTELSARTDLYAAGDCACFYDADLGRRRVEHHDHAVISGRLAGDNMTGMHRPYTHQPMFWSDLGSDVGFEAIGIVDSSLPTYAVYRNLNDFFVEGDNATPLDYSKGVVFYLKNEIVVGIVLWNLFNKMDIARLVLKEKKKFDDLTEVAKLFNIHGIKDKEDAKEGTEASQETDASKKSEPAN